MDNRSMGDADRRTRPYNLQVVKIPRGARDEFRRLTRPATYYEIRPNVAVGERAVYRVEMTEEEYERARRAADDPSSNLLSVNPDYICTADAPAAPGKTELAYLAADKAWDQSIRGQGVRVAVMDSGVSYFAGNVAAEKTFVGGSTRTDSSDHGTKMSSLAVPPQAALLIGKIDPGTGAPTSAISASIYWAVDEVSADVISVSFSGPGGDDATLMDAIKHAYDSDVLFFCSMGNHGTNEAYQPARYYQAHAIANFDSGTDSPDTYTAYGPHVFLASTGSPVTWNTMSGAVETTDYGGTSAATALAAHVAALLLSRGYSKGNVLRYMEAHARRTGASPNAEGAGVIQAGIVEKKIREDRPRKRRLDSGGSYDPVGPEPPDGGGSGGSGGSYPISRIPARAYDPDPATAKTPKDGCV